MKEPQTFEDWANHLATALAIILDNAQTPFTQAPHYRVPRAAVDVALRAHSQWKGRPKIDAERNHRPRTTHHVPRKKRAAKAKR